MVSNNVVWSECECPTQAHLSESLVLNWWYCLGRVWSIDWGKWIVEGWALSIGAV